LREGRDGNGGGWFRDENDEVENRGRVGMGGGGGYLRRAMKRRSWWMEGNYTGCINTKWLGNYSIEG
jgi:hypothetical protein